MSARTRIAAMRIGVGALFVGLSAGIAHAEVSLLSLQSACKCEALRASLTAADVAEIEKLPAQVKATLTITSGANLPGDTKAAATASAAAGPVDGNFAKVKAGKRACTVYWYGFLDNGSERVGSHQCRVTRSGDSLHIEKVTGDGFSADLIPYVPEIEAVVGRTFLPDQKERRYDKAKPANSGNDNYGNKVGLALADKGRLYLVSIDERGFTEPDDSFFEIIAIE